jgi:hypothetical protein
VRALHCYFGIGIGIFLLLKIPAVFVNISEMYTEVLFNFELPGNLADLADILVIKYGTWLLDILLDHDFGLISTSNLFVMFRFVLSMLDKPLNIALRNNRIIIMVFGELENEVFNFLTYFSNGTNTGFF